ncbi:hypothetical protein [uncultured Massilia sp.]|uniref:hypothetical protein n=1 Tax=uncultured Massilia sp. TaxID=169973 RepID=UPI00258EF467|nr:hypothetical protein [uncultured Massilia sp.]
MLNFWIKGAATPRKEPGLDRLYDPPKTAYGKKLLILSCDPATLGANSKDHKTTP